MATKTLQSVDGAQAEFVETAGSMRATVHLEAADLLTLFTSGGVEAVPAPGAGKYIRFLCAAWEWKPATGFYSNSNVILTYDGDPLYTLLEEVCDVTLFVPTVGIAIPNANVLYRKFPRTAVENKPLVLEMSSEEAFFLGGIATSTLATGGSGYAPGDTGTVDGSGTDAEYEVDTVDGGGEVLTYHLTTPGAAGYEVDSVPGTVVTTGIGDGAFTINVTEITPADGDLYVTVDYSIEDLH